jgi:hypothetical protein
MPNPPAARPAASRASKMLRHDSLRQLDLTQLTHISYEGMAPEPKLERPFGLSLRQYGCIMNQCVKWI